MRPRRISRHELRQRSAARRDMAAGIALASAGLLPLLGIFAAGFRAAYLDGNLAWLVSGLLGMR